MRNAAMGGGGESPMMPSIRPADTMMDPFDLKDWREANETNDVYAAAANRNHPDKVEMPLNTGWIKGGPGSGGPLPANPQSLLRAAAPANQPQIPSGGYRPGQVGPPAPASQQASLLGAAHLPSSQPAPAASQPLRPRAHPRFGMRQRGGMGRNVFYRDPR